MAAAETRRVPFYDTEGIHGYSGITLRLRAAINRVHNRIRVDPSSRVQRWQGALSRLMATDGRSVLEQMIPALRLGTFDHPFKNSFRALVDSRLFIEIVEQVESQLTDPDLKDLVSGNFDPALDLPSSRARDREFELFVAAVCRRAGLHVELTEPDIVIGAAGKPRRAIAAKRLFSRTNVRRNIVRASAQVERSGKPGFIVLDITRLLEPDYVLVTHWRTVHQVVGGPLLHFKDSEHRAELSRKRNDFVLGIVLRVAFPHVSHGFKLGTYEGWWAVPIEGTDHAELDRFLGYVLQGGEGC